MNLYDRIKNSKCEIPEGLDMKVNQAAELLKAAETHDRFDLMYTAFKFGYMQGCKAERILKTAETDMNRSRICDMVGKIRSTRRLERIFTYTHREFIKDGLRAE